MVNGGPSHARDRLARLPLLALINTVIHTDYRVYRYRLHVQSVMLCAHKILYSKRHTCSQNIVATPAPHIDRHTRAMFSSAQLATLGTHRGFTHRITRNTIKLHV